MYDLCIIKEEMTFDVNISEEVKESNLILSIKTIFLNPELRKQVQIIRPALEIVSVFAARKVFDDLFYHVLAENGFEEIIISVLKENDDQLTKHCINILTKSFCEEEESHEFVLSLISPIELIELVKTPDAFYSFAINLYKIAQNIGDNNEIIKGIDWTFVL